MSYGPRVSIESRYGYTIRELVVLAVGVFACSTSVIFIKASAVQPATLSAVRLAVAVIALGPLFVRDVRRHTLGPRDFAICMLPGVLLGFHFVTWIYGARLTPVVSSTLIVNLVPAVTPFLLWAAIRERLTGNEWLGTAIALSGTIALVSRDLDLSPNHFRGDAVCFASMVLFSMYLVLGRKSTRLPTVWAYVVPVYALAAVTSGLGCIGAPQPLARLSEPREILLAVGLGLVPTVLGHSALNYSMGRFRGQIVSIVNLSQPIFAGISGYALLGEVPAAMTYPACVLVLTGAVIALRRPGSRRS